MAGDIELVYETLAALERRLDRPVSAFEVNEALVSRGFAVPSFRGLIWRLCSAERVWTAAVGYHGKNRRYTHIYTAQRERAPRRARYLTPTPFRPDPGLKRAFRDVASAVRATAEALARLDEMIDSG